jgi:hypothetical protein
MTREAGSMASLPWKLNRNTQRLISILGPPDTAETIFMDIDPSKDASLFSPESRATVVIGVAVALMLCATTAVVLRLYTRKIILNQLGLDDWLSIGALVRWATRKRNHWKTTSS